MEVPPLAPAQISKGPYNLSFGQVFKVRKEDEKVLPVPHCHRTATKTG